MHASKSIYSNFASQLELVRAHRDVRTLELHAAVDLGALFIAGWDQRPDKRVVVLHRRPPHLRKTMCNICIQIGGGFIFRLG